MNKIWSPSLTFIKEKKIRKISLKNDFENQNFEVF